MRKLYQFKLSRKNYVEYFSEHSEDNAEDISFESLKDIKNLNRIVSADFNINSLRNNLDLLQTKSKENVYVSVIFETKLDDSFSAGQFKIPSLKNLIAFQTRSNSKWW